VRYRANGAPRDSWQRYDLSNNNGLDRRGFD
jgi:hypothetical protein